MQRNKSENKKKLHNLTNNSKNTRKSIEIKTRIHYKKETARKIAAGLIKNKNLKTKIRKPCEKDIKETARKIAAGLSKNISLKTDLHKPGEKAIKEIINLQNSTELLISKQPFQRLVKDISREFMPDCRIQSQALLALQTASENYIIGMFEISYQLAIHAKRRKLLPKDFILARKIGGRY